MKKLYMFLRELWQGLDELIAYLLEALIEGLGAMLRTARDVAVYVVMFCGLLAVMRVGDALAGHGGLAQLEGYALSVYELARDLLLVAGAAALQAVFFARIGRAADWPLWKVRGDAEALRRFFTLWVLINLCSLTMLRLIARAELLELNPDMTQLLTFLFFFGWIVFTPLGACVMFAGEFDLGRLLGQAAPLLTQFRMAWAIFFLNLLGFAAYLELAFLYAEHPELKHAAWLEPLLDAAFCLLDCWAFAAAWHVCRAHRNQQELEPPVDDDYDF